MSKKKSHTGFRNGDLFCFNCGHSYTIPYPQPITMAAALMTQFDKDHRDCAPTWKEPVNSTEDKTEAENANWWLVNGEQGTSSKVMFNRLIRGIHVRRVENKYSDTQHPCDPDDFKRCYKLLQAVPQWKNKLDMLRDLSDVWNKLIDNWDRLTEMYERNERENWKNYKQVGMYEFMQSIGC